MAIPNRDNNEEADEVPPNLPTELRYSTFEMCHLVWWFRWAIENSQFSMLHNFAKFSFVKSTFHNPPIVLSAKRTPLDHSRLSPPIAVRTPVPTQTSDEVLLSNCVELPFDTIFHFGKISKFWNILKLPFSHNFSGQWHLQELHQKKKWLPFIGEWLQMARWWDLNGLSVYSVQFFTPMVVRGE